MLYCLIYVQLNSYVQYSMCLQVQYSIDVLTYFSHTVGRYLYREVWLHSGGAVDRSITISFISPAK